jgi:ribosomal protein L11 methyltransferase
MSGTCSTASRTCSADADVKNYPAIEIRGALSDVLLAVLDDFSPTAIDERAHSVRTFFSSEQDRNAARAALAPHCDVTAIEVPDDDWARRTQEDLQPVTVGRLTVYPSSQFLIPKSRFLIPLIITPSMGFGTGHHATTRLCLAALQAVGVSGRFVLDIGTGSGVLAIAAGRLGAARALGIDNDADAIQSARENLALNPDAPGVTFELADLRATSLPRADVVIANLTGALLIRAAGDLLAPLGAGGVVVASGLLREERDEVVRAFENSEAGSRVQVVWEQEEDGWIGLAMKKP